MPMCALKKARFAFDVHDRNSVQRPASLSVVFVPGCHFASLSVLTLKDCQKSHVRHPFAAPIQIKFVSSRSQLSHF